MVGEQTSFFRQKWSPLPVSAALHQVKKKLFLFCVTLECSETFEDLTNSNLNLINRKSKDRKSITASIGT